MTSDDAFDARLKAAFAAAEPTDKEDFAKRVVSRLGSPTHRRMLIIGGAGAGGSTIASTQLETLFEHVAPAAGQASWIGDAAAILAYVQPETLAALTIAVMVAAFAFILPSRS